MTITVNGSRNPAAPFIVPLDHAGGNSDRQQTYQLNGASADLGTFVFSRLSELDTTSFKLLSDESLLTTNRSNLYVVLGAGGPSPVLDVVNRADGKGGPVIGGICGAGLGGLLGGFVAGDKPIHLMDAVRAIKALVNLSETAAIHTLNVSQYRLGF